MSRRAGPIRAVGRLSAAGPWVGFRLGAGDYRLVFGKADGLVVTDTTRDPVARRAGLVSAVIVHFSESLPGPPPELEATQGDMAALVDSLASTATDAGQRAVAREVLDAIDDGLPADAVVLRLQRLLPPEADPLDVLGRRWAQLRPR